MECLNCPNRSDGLGAKFCSQCGAKYLEDQKLPFVGRHKECGIFRITFAPVEGEFEHKDSANDAARHSVWDQDHEFTNYTLEFIRSTVTQETHPFICGSCKNCVAEHIEGRCNDCGEKNWTRRQE